MVRATQLRDRLRSLPADQFEDLELELEELLTHGANAEAAGATLEGFAAELRDRFHAPREVRGAAPDAVQIISGYKAKGSEWDAVIVPYFARGVTVSKPPYPRLLRDPRARETMAAFDGNDIDDALKAVLEQQDEQELERLLYVALTRARHTLVIVDDRTLFAGKNGLPSKSQAKLLRCASGDPNAAAFEALPDGLTACAKTAAGLAEKAVRLSEEPIVPLPETPGRMVEQSRDRAARFLKRNPSALAEAALVDSDPTTSAATRRRTAELPNAGKRYGTWWHGFVEELAWPGNPALWDRIFQNHVMKSPDAGRSRQEWRSLRKELTTNSELARLLTARGLVAHAEMPFLWAINPGECLDGIIDLAVRHPDAGQWVILDWKTNRLPAGGLEALRAHYLPQLSAYWKAASEMLRAPVVAGLYSTVAGKWLPYEDLELYASWENLQVHPTALAAALEDDRND
jgi:ATP-dependent exoDNAse (exonuclease V) beta subunit